MIKIDCGSGRTHGNFSVPVLLCSDLFCFVLFSSVVVPFVFRSCSSVFYLFSVFVRVYFVFVFLLLFRLCSFVFCSRSFVFLYCCPLWPLWCLTCCNKIANVIVWRLTCCKKIANVIVWRGSGDALAIDGDLFPWFVLITCSLFVIVLITLDFYSQWFPWFTLYNIFIYCF